MSEQITAPGLAEILADSRFTRLEHAEYTTEVWQKPVDEHGRLLLAHVSPFNGKVRLGLAHKDYLPGIPDGIFVSEVHVEEVTEVARAVVATLYAKDNLEAARKYEKKRVA